MTLTCSVLLRYYMHMKNAPFPLQVVSLAPDRAASYNNRAQCLRLAGRAAEALADLDTAVRLSGGGRGRAGAAARCQRGVLLRRVRGSCIVTRAGNECSQRFHNHGEGTY